MTKLWQLYGFSKSSALLNWKVQSLCWDCFSSFNVNKMALTFLFQLNHIPVHVLVLLGIKPLPLILTQNTLSSTKKRLTMANWMNNEEFLQVCFQQPCLNATCLIHSHQLPTLRLNYSQKIFECQKLRSSPGWHEMGQRRGGMYAVSKVSANDQQKFRGRLREIFRFGERKKVKQLTVSVVSVEL